jgi:hypothetical protein
MKQLFFPTAKDLIYLPHKGWDYYKAYAKDDFFIDGLKSCAVVLVKRIRIDIELTKDLLTRRNDMALGKVQTAEKGGKLGGNKPLVVKKAAKAEEQAQKNAMARGGKRHKDKK